MEGGTQEVENSTLTMRFEVRILTFPSAVDGRVGAHDAFPAVGDGRCLPSGVNCRTRTQLQTLAHFKTRTGLFYDEVFR